MTIDVANRVGFGDADRSAKQGERARPDASGKWAAAAGPAAQRRDSAAGRFNFRNASSNPGLQRREVGRRGK